MLDDFNTRLGAPLGPVEGTSGNKNPGSTRDVQSQGLNILEIIQQYAPREWRTTSNPRSAYLTRCPIHHGDDSNFAVSKDGQLWTCWSRCGGGNAYQLLQLLTGAEKPLQISARPKPQLQPKSNTKQRAPLQGITLAQLVDAKGLNLDYVTSDLGWSDGRWYGTPAVVIPYYGQSDQVLATRYRVGLTGNRFRWKKGSKVQPYGLQKLNWIKEACRVIIVEGETDYATLDFAGFPVLAVPGASSWDEQWAYYVRGLEVFLWQEPDQGGETLSAKLLGSNIRVHVLAAPGGGAKDPTELRMQLGDSELFRTTMEALMDQATVVIPERPAVLVGKDIPALIEGESPDTSVRVRVKGKNHLYPNSHKPRKKREPLWQQALELFPILRGVKPIGRSNLGVNESNQRLHVWDNYSNTWRNPQNANHKRRQNYMGLVPILNSEGPWFTLNIPLDDLGDDEAAKKRHHAYLVAVGRMRQKGHCISIDNLLARGVISYIANGPLKGFEPIDDPVAWLVSSLKAIRPPRHDEDQESSSDSEETKPKAFRPIKGTRRIQVASEKAVDENQNRLRLIARSAKATDFIMVEATAQTVGMDCQYSAERLFRSQCSDYSLTAEYRTLDQVLRLAEGLEGYELTKFAREEMADVRIGF